MGDGKLCYLLIVTGVRGRYGVLREPSHVGDLHTYRFFCTLRAGRLRDASCIASEPRRRLHACQSGSWRRKASYQLSDT